MKRTAAFTVLCILLMSLLVGGSGGRAEGLRVQAGVDAANVPMASPDWTAESDQANAQFGNWVGTAGDVNGDSVADVIVGAPAYDGDQTDEGRAYVYHGAIIGLRTRPTWTVEGDQLNARMGPVSTAGDINGDGFADVIVGAPAYDGGETDEGRVYVYHGSARGLSPTPNWSAESDQAGAEFGHSVRTAGDVNGDGFADVIVGAPRYGQNRGRAYLYHGSPSGLSLFPNWTVEGDQLGALFGWSVGTAGDVNGDGYDDVIISAMWYSNPERWEGRVYGYYGSAFGLSPTPNWVVESNRGFAHLGFSASAAGDVNGDGYDDVIIGAPSYYDWYDGRVFVYHGSATGLSTTPNWTARDDQADTDFGLSVGSAGDVNGDGFADVIIGAWGYDNGQT
ncbi:MAG: integrin alpha, partial [Caldilineales bacterium]|nr:integrin alpha [Caldilineales bacterium]